MAAERVLLKHPNPTTDTLLQHILNSGRRGPQLVEDILDFARGRLGVDPGGDRRLPGPSSKTLQQVISEVRSVHPSARSSPVLAN